MITRLMDFNFRLDNAYGELSELYRHCNDEALAKVESTA